MDDNEVRSAVMAVPKAWRDHWCDGGICACLGCANRCGGLAAKGISKEQWERVMQPSIVTYERALSPATTELCEDGKLLRWLISSGATITLPNGASMSMSEPLFRNALDLAMLCDKVAIDSPG